MTVSSTSFTHKRLRATIKLGQGNFGEEGFDTIAFSNMRMSADVLNTTNQQMGSMQLRIWGLSFEHMQKLSVLQKPPNQPGRKNMIILEAGDDETGLHVVHEGDINLAWGDFQHQPDVYFLFQTISLLSAGIKPLPPVSYQGSADVATMMEGMAKSAGCRFENNGVDAKLSNPYFPGTAREQLRACADAAGIEWAHDRGTISIWPAKKARRGDIPVLTPTSGLIGYPAFSEFGLVVRALFDPALKIGELVEIRDSEIKPANGQWKVWELAYNLESEMPNGNWEMTFTTLWPQAGTKS